MVIKSEGIQYFKNLVKINLMQILKTAISNLVFEYVFEQNMKSFDKVILIYDTFQEIEKEFFVNLLQRCMNIFLTKCF